MIKNFAFNNGHDTKIIGNMISKKSKENNIRPLLYPPIFDGKKHWRKIIFFNNQTSNLLMKNIPNSNHTAIHINIKIIY